MVSLWYVTDSGLGNTSQIPRAANAKKPANSREEGGQDFPYGLVFPAARLMGKRMESPSVNPVIAIR